jgi:multicomponent Na+:H+ antiporter subunit D
MAVAYVWRIVEAAAFAPITGDTDNGETRKNVPATLLVVTWIVAVANIVFGLAPALPLELSTTAADILLGHMR